MTKVDRFLEELSEVDCFAIPVFLEMIAGRFKVEWYGVYCRVIIVFVKITTDRFQGESLRVDCIAIPVF